MSSSSASARYAGTDIQLRTLSRSSSPQMQASTSGAAGIQRSTGSLRAAQRRQFIAASLNAKRPEKERNSDAGDPDDPHAVDLLATGSWRPATNGRDDVDDETRLLLGEGESEGQYDGGWTSSGTALADSRVRGGKVRTELMVLRRASAARAGLQKRPKRRRQVSERSRSMSAVRAP